MLLILLVADRRARYDRPAFETPNPFSSAAKWCILPLSRRRMGHVEVFDVHASDVSELVKISNGGNA